MQNKKRMKIAFCILLVLLLSYSILSNLSVYGENPFSRKLSFHNPIFAAGDSSGNVYLIDEGMKRVLVLDAAGNTRFSLTGGQEASGLHTALEVASDQKGNLYVLNNVLDDNGQYVEQEGILRYGPDGRWLDQVYALEYKEGDRPLRTGNISAVTLREDRLYFYYKLADAFQLVEVYLPTLETSILQTVSFPQAVDLIMDFALGYDSQTSYFTTKRAEIFQVGPDGTPRLLYGEQAGAVVPQTLPWEVETDREGNLFFTDLLKRSIRKISPEGTISEVLSHEVLEAAGYDSGHAIFYRIAAEAEGTLTTVANEQVLRYDQEEQVTFFSDGSRLSMGAYLYRFFLWLQLLLLAGLGLYGFVLLARFLRYNPSKVLLQSVFVMAVICISTLLVSNTIFTSFENRYEKEVFQRISQILHLTARSLDGEAFSKIKGPQDFMGEAYQQVREQLHGAFNYNQDEWGEGFYGALYTVSDRRPYVIMYYDDSKSPFYPLYEDGSEVEYFAVFEEELTLVNQSADAEGNWMYGMAPLYNRAGEVVGILEVGTDLYGFTQANNRLRNDVIMQTLTLLVALIFMLIEITIFADVLSRKRLEKVQETEAAEKGRLLEKITGLDALAVRPMGFLVYCACFLSGSFVPLFMKELYQGQGSLWGLAESVVLALPLSAEALFMALSALIGGYVIDKRGWKPTFVTGMGVLFAGQLLSALAVSPLWFIGARAVSGMGMGLAFISLQNYVVLPSGEEDRNKGISALNSSGFAGLNAGLIIGGMLAERLGFSPVFFVSAGLVLVCGLVSLRFMKNAVAPAVQEGKGSFGSLLVFFKSLRILAFFSMALLPIVICTMFLDYFFPLFGQQAGLSPASVSRAFLLNGLSIIYLGPVLSEYLLKKIGNYKAMLLAAGIMALALVQFALFGTLGAALIAIFLFGISESFGIVARINYFSSTEESVQLGQGKALGYYGLGENFGQILGPLVYGMAMELGMLKGIGMIGGGLAILFCGFFMMTFQKEKGQAASAL